MGITANCSKFLFYSKKLGASFDKTLMLGRLELFATKNELTDYINLFNNNTKKISEVNFRDKYSEPLFEILGANSVDSMDVSSYEDATILHDLNQPIPDSLKKRFSAIVDGGTIEHVFNFPVAIKNCMEALSVGGHYIGITPANNTMGHGFYQFSPELFYNIFNKGNGFKIKTIIIFTQNSNGKASDWYETVDPVEANTRIMLVNGQSTYLLVLAEKIADVPVFAATPQQSDYQSLWAIKEALKENKVPANEGRIKFILRKIIPQPLINFTHNVVGLFTRKKIVDEGLGEIDAKYYKKVEIK